jgi:copper chaperone NosL
MATRTMSQDTLRAQDNTTARPARARVRLLTWLPPLLLIVASVLLIASIAFPYWGMILEAPQYPGGLQMRLFVNRMEGNPDTRLDEVREIDNLNHYIGMRSMYDAAPIERAIAIPGIIGMVIALGVVAFVRRRWLWLLAIPPLIFPVIFLADLGLWMRYYGMNLDPTAPLSSSIRPFAPVILGDSVIGQFRTVAYVDVGWYMATAAAILVLIALLVRLYASRRAGEAG